MPTDIGGGGPNPPHGEDFFNRIMNVHWPVSAEGDLAVEFGNKAEDAPLSLSTVVL